MKSTMPTAENLAKLLLSVRLSERERSQIIRSLNFLSERQIIRLFDELKVLQAQEKKLFKGLLEKIKK
jgi:hypothetical protein